MLQRGFAAKSGKQNYIYAYGKTGEPQKKNTKDFGNEELFYGPEGSTADENITDFELRMERHIQAARRAPNGQVLDSEKMAAFVGHLEMRSLFLRSEMIRLSDEMINNLRFHLSSPRQAERLLVRHLKSHPELITNELDKLKLLPRERALAEDYTSTNLATVIEEFAPVMAAQASVFFSTMGATLIEAAKQAHIKALEQDFFTVERVEIYKGWSFFVQQYHEDVLVLPDTALAFLGKSECAPFRERASRFSQVIVPVSDKTVIVGCAKKSVRRTADELNRILASCSYLAYAARYDTSELRKLSRRIGKNAELISKNDLRRIFSFESLLGSM